MQGSKFRVQVSGFRVQGSGFRAQGSGFRLQASGVRVQGSGFRVQGSGFRVRGSGFRVQGLGLECGVWGLTLLPPEHMSGEPRFIPYRGTSLIRKRHPVGLYSRLMPRVLGGS